LIAVGQNVQLKKKKKWKNATANIGQNDVAFCMGNVLSLRREL
jgi:hypothetical protein